MLQALYVSPVSGRVSLVVEELCPRAGAFVATCRGGDKRVEFVRGPIAGDAGARRRRVTGLDTGLWRRKRVTLNAGRRRNRVVALDARWRRRWEEKRRCRLQWKV